MTISLRPYQERAVLRLRDHIRAGVRRLLLVSPTGSGKCVTPDTFVWSNGLRRFGEVWGCDRIAAPHGVCEVKGWYDDGERDGYRVTLECGLTIDATPAHRVWVRTRHGNEGWRFVGELTSEDYVAVARGEADFGARTMPDDEAYLLGLLIADGYVSPHSLQIDKQRPVLEHVRSVVDRWLQRAGGRGAGSRINDISPYHAVLRCNGNFLPFLQDQFQIDWTFSEHREVPRCVREGNRDVVRAFLRGYFDGDGYCDRAPGVSSASGLLIEQVHQLLLGLGVYASHRVKETAGLPAHMITVRDSTAFAREVGFSPFGLIKDRAFAHLLERRRNTNVDLVPGMGPLLQLAAAHVPKLESRRDAWRHVDAYYSGDKLPSYRTLDELLVALPACPERGELERIAHERRAWSRIESVVRSRQHRIDCEVAGQHAFIGNGLVNHNTTIAGHLVTSAVARGRRVLFVAHRRELISQAYQRIVQMGVPEHDVGIVMGQDHRRRPGAPVQVASIDTLRHRAKPLADIVFRDEAHRALSRSDRELAAQYPHAIHIGLTATPYRSDGRGLGEAYDVLVVVAQPRELIADGFLVEPRVFTVPAGKLPDLGGVCVRGGDYDERELANAVDRSVLVGNIVDHWLKHAASVRTVAFAVSVAHSRHIVERFRDAGIAAEHLDGETPTGDRDAILARLDAGTTTVVSNCNVLVEGWDQPSVKCAILARPTKSTGLYLQQAGRILRPWNDQRAIILDHAGCAVEHGLPQDERVYTLGDLKRKRGGRGQSEPPARVCPDCQAVMPLAVSSCPECGYVFDTGPVVPEEGSGELVELRPDHRADDPATIEHDRLRALASARRPDASLDAKRAYFQRLLATEPSQAWARARYQIETRELPPEGT